MRVLRLRAYYDPEQTAGVHFDHDLSEAFMNNKIHYITYTPSPTRGVTKEVREEYKKRKKEISYNGFTEINRFKMFRELHNPIQRAFRYIVCSIKEYKLGTKEKNIDVVYSSSTPPTQGMLSAKVAKKLTKKYGHKVPFIYNLQDVFPDSLVNVGMTKKGSVIWKIGRIIENYTYKNADKIIVISEGFKRNIVEKGVPEEKIVVVSNWVDLTTVRPVNREYNTLFDDYKIDRSMFIVLYAGNLGEAQDSEVIINAAKELASIKDIKFVIFGGGVKYPKIKLKAEKMENVLVNELLPQERVSEIYSMGNVALITCKAGTGNAGMPSKTWSIMGCNVPIIASFDTDSDLADVLKESGAGCCIEPGSGKKLADSILSVYSDWKQGKGNVTDIREYALKNASKEVCVKKYIDTLYEVVNANN